MAKRLFTSESVTEGHPDKICDQISDAVLDAILEKDPNGRVACETAVSTGLVHIMGEITTNCYVDIPKIARGVIRDIGYDRAKYGFDCDTCGVIANIDEQSSDIAMGVDNSFENKESGASELDNGAGDQGMMFGYACNETPLYIPLSLALSHALVRGLAEIRREGRQMTYLRPDSKSQVTVEYDENGKLARVHTIVISTQHDEFIVPDLTGLTPIQAAERQDAADAEMCAVIAADVRNILIPRVRQAMPENLRHFLDEDYTLYVNPTGKFVVGGPNGDTGLTGRKIIVDTYGGHGAHGGGAFSGKDPSKVDRSAAYAARHIAKNLVAAGVADRALVQVAYAIGVAKPVSVCVNTYGTAHVNLSDARIGDIVAATFDLTPHAIEKELKLRQPIYRETASYGHMGRIPRTVTKTFVDDHGTKFQRNVELFTWEKTDRIDDVRRAFGL